MARKKSKSTQAKIALTRLAQDEQVQKQLRTGTLRLREAYSRASGKPVSRAVGDKKIYSKLQEAGDAFGSAGRKLRRKPEPKKRTGRKLAIAAALAGAVAFVAKKKAGGESAEAPTSTDFGQPSVVPSRAPTSGAPAPVAAA